MLDSELHDTGSSSDGSGSDGPSGLTDAPAAAQFQKPEDAVKYRKAAFTVMATHFGRLGAMVQGRIPFDAAVAVAPMA